jgi:DNA-binding response OmpR family regulator
MIDAAVIYIEDDENEALLFRLGLKPRGIQVLHIPDSRPETLNMLKEDSSQRARAIFIDLWVGVMNGIDLARLLREWGDQRPLFLLTSGDNPDPNLLRELNVTYMPKPPDFPRLAKLILSLPEV